MTLTWCYDGVNTYQLQNSAYNPFFFVSSFSFLLPREGITKVKDQ